MSQEEYYIGEFLIQIFANTQEYIRIYDSKPFSVAVKEFNLFEYAADRIKSVHSVYARKE